MKPIYSKEGQKENHMNLRRVASCGFCKFAYTGDYMEGGHDE